MYLLSRTSVLDSFPDSSGLGHAKAKIRCHSDAQGLLQERVEENLEHVEVDAGLLSVIFLFISFIIHRLTLNPSCNVC